MNTTEMSESLRERLISYGWKPENVIWGRRVQGNVHGVTIELNGKETYYTGPFVCVQSKDQLQVAIVRWD